MTFFEAAITVLNAAGRPLHYKKITEIAIRRGLLSHVGKTPEFTMGTRLNQELRKDDGTSVLLRTRPGVFSLRCWSDGAPLPLEDHRETVRLYTVEVAEVPSPAATSSNEMFEGGVEELAARPAAIEGPAASRDTPDGAAALAVGGPSDSVASLELSLEASVLGESIAAGRRRRRRRRRLGEAEGESSAEGELVADGEEVEAELDAFGGGESLEVLSEEASRGAEPSDADADHDAVRVEAVASVESAPEEATSHGGLWSPSPGSEEGVGTLADRVERVLLERFDDPDGVAATRLLDALELGEGEGGGNVDTLRIALLADNLERFGRRRLPRFEDNGRGSWRLARWAHSDGAREGLGLMLRGAEALEVEAIQQVQSWLTTLPVAGLETLVGLLVGRMAGREFEVCERGPSGFVASWVSGLTEQRTSLWLVSELAGWSWEAGWAWVLGEGESTVVVDLAFGASSGSRDRLPGSVRVLDGRALSRLLVEHRIGVRAYDFTAVFEDAPFILALGATEPAGSTNG